MFNKNNDLINNTIIISFKIVKIFFLKKNNKIKLVFSNIFVILQNQII